MQTEEEWTGRGVTRGRGREHCGQYVKYVEKCNKNKTCMPNISKTCLSEVKENGKNLGESVRIRK